MDIYGCIWILIYMVFVYIYIYIWIYIYIIYIYMDMGDCDKRRYDGLMEMIWRYGGILMGD